ncbi:relaxase/mobilization nuclease RlxS [Novosphingobium terrae]|uniref:relaxase/mobilization nuclease RlxS n=1 Tax=Novosphingobium terrae TaxID=2726189 RepID=UPI00197D1DC4|nr:relaxase/mobilization nuclease RlxS [Novosphingobium terrae]
MDDDFKPHLSPPRSRPAPKRYLSQIIKAAQRSARKLGPRSRRFDGSRIGRGAARARVLASGDRHAAFRSRRVIVKTRLTLLGNKGLAAARAHLRYIERDGVSRSGEPGQLYGAEVDQADRDAFLDRCDEDRHQFRFIVSPEDGDQYDDLKSFTRRLMTRMEEDLDTKLDWVAVDHYNTGHPHTHIVLRGKDDMGQNLVIAREYISHGLREHAMRIATLDLGPRTDLEIEQRLMRDMEAERLTAIDRQLLRDMDGERTVSSHAGRAMDQTLRTGRLRKLESMGLAEPVTGDRWRVVDDLEGTLRRMGERGDIIRTMQRDLATRKLARSPADQAIYDPGAANARPIVGRVVMRGLADELEDRHYLIVDAIDGRTHYAPIGRGEATGPLPTGAIVRIAPRSAGMRDVDRTIMDVAAAHGGRYSLDIHLRHDPQVSEAFAQTHVRRLEAMRRITRGIDREDDGSWVIAPDHLDKVTAFEARQQRDRPVDVETLSPLPLGKLADLDAATVLDRELTASAPMPLRDAGFGKDLRTALIARRQWLIEQDLAREHAGQTTYRQDMLEVLRRRELLRVASGLSKVLERPFVEMKPGERIEGRLLRSIELASGKHALVERSRDFTLVPWREVLERRIGQTVSGIMREGPISWNFGPERGGPNIS